MIFKYPVLKGAVFLLFKKYRIFLQKSVFFMQKMYYNIFCIICAIMRCFLISYDIIQYFAWKCNGDNKKINLFSAA